MSLIIRETQITTTLSYHLPPVRMAVIKKARNDKCWQRCGGKGRVARECKWVQPLWKTVRWPLRKWKTEIPYDPAVPVLYIYLKKGKTLTPVFAVAWFTVTKIRKQPKCPFSLSKEDVGYIYPVCVCVCMCLYTWVLLSHEKETSYQICNCVDGPLGNYAKWIKSEDKCHMGSIICEILKKKKSGTHRSGEEIGGCQSWGCGEGGRGGWRGSKSGNF